MIRKLLISCFLLASATVLSDSDAASFINLDFEQANTNTLSIRPNNPFPYPFGTGPLQDLLPGWNLVFGGIRNDPLNFNATFTGLGVATLVSREAGGLPSLYFGSRFEGNYVLAFSLDATGTFTLSQEGQVPAGTRILRYDGNEHPSLPVEARINGTFVPNGGDVSAFAGQNVELEFRIYQKETLVGARPPFVGFNGASFVVPEPRVLSILGIGTVLCFWLLRRRR